MASLPLLKATLLLYSLVSITVVQGRIYLGLRFQRVRVYDGRAVIAGSRQIVSSHLSSQTGNRESQL